MVPLGFLFSPLKIGGLDLANRVVMAPMTRYFAKDGVLTSDAAAYYRRRAEGGAGLIITEGAAIPHPVAQFRSTTPDFFGEAALAVWRQIVEAVHAAGSSIMIQLWHPGLGREVSRTNNPHEPSIGPSGYHPFAEAPTRSMTDSDIADVIAAYGEAAATAQALGFDGVNIHGGHGYLIDEFFWTETNRRDDGYNGAIADRVRFGVEVVREMRRRVRADFPIMFRFSQWKTLLYTARNADDPAELEQFVGPLADAGVDAFDASMRRFWIPEFEGSDMNLAGWIGKLTGKLSMAVGSITLEGPLRTRTDKKLGEVAAASAANLVRLGEMMERGDFDLACVGRAMLANPDWANIIREGAFDELRAYDPASLIQLECSEWKA
jgi:2,4-dienoyl-CoA reductase-like NADH-dependent reductase (Old Yellow Enzyme family)